MTQLEIIITWYPYKPTPTWCLKISRCAVPWITLPSRMWLLTWLLCSINLWHSPRPSILDAYTISHKPPIPTRRASESRTSQELWYLHGWGEQTPSLRPINRLLTLILEDWQPTRESCVPPDSISEIKTPAPPLNKPSYHHVQSHFILTNV